MGRTSRRRRSLLGRDRTTTTNSDARDDVSEEASLPPQAPPSAAAPESALADPSPHPQALDAPEPGRLALPEPAAVAPPEPGAPPPSEPAGPPRSAEALSPGALAAFDDGESPPTEEVPLPKPGRAAPEMRFVPRHRMMRGHVREPEPEPLLTDAELKVVVGAASLATGFTLVGGGGLLLVWYSLGDGLFRAFGR